MTNEQLFTAIEEVLHNHPTEVSTSGPKGENLIARAEAYLGVSFPPSYREFLRRWGALGFAAEEVYGITSENFEAGKIPNGVWFTAQERLRFGLPANLVVVVNADGDEYYCIDTAENGPEGEAPVVIWDVSSRAVVGRKSPSFGDFLLTRVREAEEILNDD